jgi:hypothetical protein
MDASVADGAIPDTASRKVRLALAHNLAASLSPLVAPPDADTDDDDVADAEDAVFPNEKEWAAGAGADDELFPNENAPDGAAAAVAGAALCPPKENPVTPAGAGATTGALVLPNEKEASPGAEVPLVRSTFAKGFPFLGGESPVELGTADDDDDDDGAGAARRVIFKVLRALRTSSDAREKPNVGSSPSPDSKRCSTWSFVS